ncbi:MAG TPA: right-handed parallel beta-helix repeat-containing protein [Alphaproteobacteria bacterium]|nr:right-handed parallel beta-helix repeat-containing protein [Alphaproteobacteria bacterium]
MQTVLPPKLGVLVLAALTALSLPARADMATCPKAPATVPDSPAPTVPAVGQAVPAPSLAGAWPALAGLPPRCPAVPLVGVHATYNIGPGKKYADLTSFPWLNLRAGDVVNIYYSPTPYATKIALRAAGTPAKPVIINGVADSKGRLPTITGKNAVTAKDAIKQKYYLSSGGQLIETGGVIIIFKGYNDAYEYKVTNLTIQNLHITGGSEVNHFTDHAGKTQTYDPFSAGIYVVKSQYLTVQNNEISGNGLGVFVNNKDDLPGTSYFTVIRGNYLHDNGVNGDDHEHNLYVQGIRTLYEGNYIGQLMANAPGSALKDRGSGPVVRYNTIISAARAVDLVESQSDPSSPTFADPLYNYGWVYGNLIIDDFSLPDGGSVDPIHWGGDQYGYATYHNGPAYFYDNTVIIKATQAQAYHLAVFDLATSQQTMVLSNNIIVHKGTSQMNACTNSSGDGSMGTLKFADTNWASPFYTYNQCKLDKTGGTLLKGNPVLTTDYRLPMGSAAIGKGDAFPPTGVTFPKPASAANLKVTEQYTVKPNAFTVEPGYAPRKNVKDLGAFPYP